MVVAVVVFVAIVFGACNISICTISRSNLGSTLSYTVLSVYCAAHHYPTMVGYHAHFTVCRAIGDGTSIYSSRRPGDYVVYRAEAPMQGFPDLPVDYAWVDTYWTGDKEELYELMRDKQADYIACEVYRDYNSPQTRSLDLFARCGDSSGWALYELCMPADPPPGAIDAVDAPYPQPADWFLATRRRYVRHVSYEDYVEYTSSDSDAEMLPMRACCVLP